MVVPAGREKHRVPPIPGGHLEPEHVAVERQRPVEVGDREMDVPDPGLRVDAHPLE